MINALKELEFYFFDKKEIRFIDKIFKAQVCRMWQRDTLGIT